MHLRKTVNARVRLGGRAYVPIDLYRHNLTIQTGTLWKEGVNETGILLFLCCFTKFYCVTNAFLSTMAIIIYREQKHN